nr:transcription termination factor mterf15, mitochondrial [Quercus suber]
MFGFLSSRQLLFISNRRRTQLGLLQKNAFFIIQSFTSVGRLSESEFGNEAERNYFTVSYLVNSCGLSPKSALLASNKVHFQNPDRPDSVLSLLKENGFDNTQITKLIRSRPTLLLADPENTLLPKIEFFRSIGVSGSDLPRILTVSPDLLRRSLTNHLIPCYDFLKSVLLVNEKVITTMKRSQRAFLCDVTNVMAPNVALLRELGAPQSSISLLVTHFPSMAFITHAKFVKAVQEVKELGFDPSKTLFVQAIQAVLKLKKPMWESKFEIFRRWGWSEADTLLAFKKHPICMLLSEEKITKAMKFLVSRLGFSSKNIAKNPVVLNLSLEKRIIPRCSVVQILLAKDLVKNDLSLATFLLPTEKCFLEKFVIRFQDNVPQLLSVYQNKMELLDVEIQSEKWHIGHELLPTEKCFLEKFVTRFQDDVPQLLSVYQNKMDLLDVQIQSEKCIGYGLFFFLFERNYLGQAVYCHKNDILKSSL